MYIDFDSISNGGVMKDLEDIQPIIDYKCTNMCFYLVKIIVKILITV